MKNPSAKNPAPKLHQVSEKAFMPTKKLFSVVWLSIKRWRDQMNAGWAWFKPIGLNHWFKPWFKPAEKTN